MKFLKSPTNALGVALLLPFFLGLFFPEFFWASHTIHFLPLGVQVLLFFGALACFWPGFQQKLGALVQSVRFLKGRSRSLLAIAFALLMGFIFHHFPIAFDNYGEAFNYAPFLDDTVDAVSQETWDWLLTFDLKPASGRRTLLSLYALLAYITGLNYGSVFQWVDTVFGAIFIALWLWAVAKQVPSVALRIILWIGVVSAPLTLVFYGHIDTYSVIYTGLLSWLVAMMHAMKHRSKRTALYLIPGLLLLIKLHPLMVLLVPALGLTLVHSFWSESSLVKGLLTVKGLMTWVLLPIFLAGAGLYFFVFEDYADERLLQNVRDFDRLFLPMVSPEAPLDRYNLFSWQHFLDVFNALLWWSPVMLFVGILLSLRAKKETLTSPLVLILSLTFILFSTFLFAINPLISMPMDWDLFSIPGIVFFVLVLALASAQQDVQAEYKGLSVGLSLSLLCLPVFIVHTNTEMLSKRLTTVGIWVYQSYYEHSARYIHQAIAIGVSNPEAYIDQKLEVMHQIKPHALVGKDVKYASMCTDNALIYWKDLKDYAKAKQQFEEALVYDPSYSLNRWHYLQLLEELGAIEMAFVESEVLVQQAYPTQNEAVVLAARLAKESGNVVRLSYYCTTYASLLKDAMDTRSLCDDPANAPTN